MPHKWGNDVVEARAVLIATIVAVMTLVLLLATVASEHARLVLPGEECENTSNLDFMPGSDRLSDEACSTQP